MLSKFVVRSSQREIPRSVLQRLSQPAWFSCRCSGFLSFCLAPPWPRQPLQGDLTFTLTQPDWTHYRLVQTCCGSCWSANTSSRLLLQLLRQVVESHGLDWVSSEAPPNPAVRLQVSAAERWVHSLFCHPAERRRSWAALSAADPLVHSSNIFHTNFLKRSCEPSAAFRQPQHIKIAVCIRPAPTEHLKCQVVSWRGRIDRGHVFFNNNNKTWNWKWSLVGLGDMKKINKSQFFGTSKNRFRFKLI